jgi:threonine dehydratase
MLSEEEKKRGVISASAGNHALGLAYHGQQLGTWKRFEPSTF